MTMMDIYYAMMALSVVYIMLTAFHQYIRFSLPTCFYDHFSAFYYRCLFWTAAITVVMGFWDEFAFLQ